MLQILFIMLFRISLKNPSFRGSLCSLFFLSTSLLLLFYFTNSRTSVAMLNYKLCIIANTHVMLHKLRIIKLQQAIFGKILEVSISLVM